MKRPAVVWIYSFLVSLGVFFAILGVIGSIVGLFEGEKKTAYVGFLIMNTIIFIIDIIFLYYFFMLKEKAKTWVHISFATSLAVLIISDVITFTQYPEEATISYIYIIAALIMWWIVYDYIKKKKIDDKLLYSN